MSLLLMGAGLATDGAAITLPDRFWVLTAGGSWNGTATSKWSLVTGGASGAAEPALTNYVALDGNSGANTITIVTATAVCKGLTCVGFVGTLAGSTAMSNYGSLTLSAGMTLTYTGQITFLSTAAGNTITTAGKSTASVFVLNGVGGSWQLQDNFTSTNQLLVTNGTLDTNGKTVTLSNLYSITGSGTVSLTYGASIFNISSSMNLTNTNAIISAASSTFNISGAGSFTSVAATYGTLNFTGTASSSTPALANTAANGALVCTILTRTGTGYINLFYRVATTVASQLTVVGTNANTQRAALLNDRAATALGLVCNGTATITNADFEGITVTGSAAPISGTSIGDWGRNTGITFDAPVTRTMVTAAGSNDYMGDIWAASSGGVPDGLRPLGQDTTVIDSNSFATAGRTLDIASYRVKNLDFTNATNNPALTSSGTAFLYGDLKLIAGMTTVSGTLRLSAMTGTQTITTAGVTINLLMQLTETGTVALADDLTVASPVSFFGGTLVDNNHNVTTGVINFNIFVGTATWNKGTGTYTLTGTGNVFNLPASSSPSLTFTDAGTTKITNNSTSSKRVLGGSGIAFNILWNATAGTGTLDIDGSNSFVQYISDASRTTRITGGTTQTINTLTLGASCTVSSTSATGYTLVNSSGIPWASTGTTVSRCTCVGGWTVTGGVDGGNNVGITFI